MRVSLKHSCAPKLQHLLTEGISIKLKFLQKLFPTHSQTILISTRIISPAISGLHNAARRLERMLGVGVTVCLHTEALALWCWSERPSRRFLSLTLSIKTYYLELRYYKVDFFNFIPANAHCDMVPLSMGQVAGNTVFNPIGTKSKQVNLRLVRFGLGF